MKFSIRISNRETYEEIKKSFKRLKAFYGLNSNEKVLLFLIKKTLKERKLLKKKKSKKTA